MDSTDESRFRTGRYVQQPTGYRAFVPNPLPPNPPIRFDDEMVALLAETNLAIGRLDGASGILPNADLFVATYVSKEAVLSSQIEGTQASLVDVLAFEYAAAEPENPQDVAEVVNYIQALNYGLERLQTLPLSLRLIREIHERLMVGVRGADKHPGEFRTSQNWIGHAGSTLNNAAFVPPSPTDMREALGQLEHFMHADDKIAPLVKIAMIHAQFETIHPFLDGNGRMGRLLITFYLCQQLILEKPLLYLSLYFKQRQQEYYACLQRVREVGAWEEWLAFFLRGVCAVAQESATVAHNIVELRERHRALIVQEKTHNAASGLQLLEMLYERPITTVAGAAERLGVAYSTANTLIARFVGLGILRMMTQGERNRRFIYTDYLAMFTDDLPSVADQGDVSEITYDDSEE